MKTTKYDGLKLSNQLCFPLYAAAKEVVRQYRPHLDAIGLTYTQYIAMMVLWEEETLSVKALGERLYLDSGTLSPLLKNLEDKGYLSRARAEYDERVLLVKLTDGGRALREKAVGIPEAIGACVDMDAEEAGMLYGLLYKLLGKLR